jgi:hypothetical protein
LKTTRHKSTGHALQQLDHPSAVTRRHAQHSAGALDGGRLTSLWFDAQFEFALVSPHSIGSGGWLLV